MTELNMNLPERALEALGKTRSELTRYKQQNAEQQKRIRELESFARDMLYLSRGAEREKMTTKSICATIRARFEKLSEEK